MKFFPYILIALLLPGCAVHSPLTSPSVNLAEINQHIVRPAESIPASPDSASVEPRSKDFASVDHGNNPLLSKVSPASVQAKQPVKGEGGGIMLNFNNANIHEVIKVFAETLNFNYIVNPKVEGFVSIRSGNPIPKSQLFTVFKKLLHTSGLDIIPEGDHYYIFASDKTSPQAINGPGQVGSLKNSSRVVTQIVPLLYLKSTDALKLVSPYLSGQAVTYDLPEQNTLIVTDLETKIADVVQILSFLDVSPLASYKMRLVRVENASLPDLYKELTQLLVATKLNKTGSDSENVVDSVNIIPLERVNSLLVISQNAFLISNIDAWIAQLDVSPQDFKGQTIYHVRNSSASDLAQLVNAYLTHDEPKASAVPVAPKEDTGKPAAAAPAAPLSPSAPVVASATSSPLVPDDKRNVILIRSKQPSESLRIVKLLESLDTVPSQVLIEVMVAEITLNDRLEYGLEWALKNNSSFLGSTNFSNFVDPATLLGSTGSIIKGDMRGLFNALANETNVSILSSPQVLVENNAPATINVGDQVPIINSEIVPSSANGQTLTRSIQYRDTGIILHVTPRIGSDGLISLDVDQQVSNASENSLSGISSPVISTRQLKTRFSVKAGQSIMIGGMIRRDTNTTEIGIPFLKNIPGLGFLFNSHKSNATRTELILMLTPYVIDSQDEVGRQ
ncbi:MAG: type II secretion system secretin GspD [Desulfurivibrionaceae bacterium]